MATGVAGLASASGVFTPAAGVVSSPLPIIGWVVTIAAAYIDAAFIYPRMLGDGPESARPPRLQDVPVGSNQAGAPRIWAIGAAARVPTHILWQASKVRESQSTAMKGGTSTTIRRVYINALISLNDRQTEDLIHLIGNGKLLLYKSRNIIAIVSSQMSVTSPGNLPQIAMASTSDPTFVDKFEVGDIVKPTGFVYEAGGTDFNGTSWRVTAVTDHTPGSPSVLSIRAADGQDEVATQYGGGTVFSPARVERVDDAIVQDMTAGYFTAGSGGYGNNTLVCSPVTGTFRDGIFSPGDKVRVRNLKGAVSGTPINTVAEWDVVFAEGWRVTLENPTASINTGNYVTESSVELPTIEYVDPPTFTRGIFPDEFDPEENYGDGAEDQGENALLATDKGTGNIPAFRGMAVQGLESFFATQFGDQLPFSLEALIGPDASITWKEAAAEVLRRGGVPDAFIDTTAVPETPFAGMYLRGAVPTLTAMQPMIVAGQLVGQERDGTVALFTIDDADVVQIENGASYSDFATIVDGEQRTDTKVRVEDQAEEDLPTSVGVRHQDPDNQFSEGYQHFGLRNPEGVSHQNEQDVDLSNIVLTRKEARNLATTLLRRAWVNRRRYYFMLPAAYIDLLENDICTFTTDSGNVVRCRIIQRDVGADFRVSVVAVSEDVDLAVSGSPVQTGAGGTVPIVIPPAYLRVVPIDAPGVRNRDSITPAIKLAICADGGGLHWAGAAIYESVNGASYQAIGQIGNQAAIAQLDTDLTAQTASEEYGTTTVTVRAQTVDVTFAYEGDTALEAATQAEAEAGKNWCAIVGVGTTEIAAFTTVTPLGDRRYTLGGWLRGLRGTSPALQVNGSQLVMFHPAQDHVVYREFPGSILPTSLAYKIVPAGEIIDNIAAIGVTTEWNNARPLPVRSVTKTIGASPYDARFEVDANWCRQVLPLGTQPPHPMDEPFEAYRFDIYDPTGVTLLRSHTLSAQGSGSSTLRDRWYDYTAADQTTDGYTPGPAETFWVDVVQIGEFGDSPSILEEL